MNDMNFRRDGTAAVPGPIAGADGSRGASKALFPILGQYLAVVLRHRWLIFGAVVTALITAVIVTVLMTPEYTSRITVEIRRDSDNIMRVEGVEPETGLGDMEFYQTQYGLLQSHALAQRVATQLRLYDDPEFFAMYGLPQAEDWFENGRPRSEITNREQRVRKAADVLLLNLSVNPVRLSRLVHVGYTSPDATFSARVANAWGEQFIRITLERRFEATSYARNFLEQRLEQLRDRLDASERQLVGYAAREGIVNLPANPQLGAPERSMVVDDLTTLNRELAEATSDRVKAESRLPGGRGTVTEALNNQAISGLRQRRAEAAAEYSRLMVQFEPEYPPVVALREQIAQLDQSIAREEARVRDTLSETYRASTERETNLSGRVDRLKGDLLDLRRRSIQYNIYQREVDTNRQLYDALLQRYKEIGVAGGVGVNNISVVDRGQIPERPSSPRVLINLLLALGLGLTTGFMLAAILEQVDDAVSDPSQIVDELGTPLLGTVPKSRDEDTYLALGDRKSDLAEAYLAVQTSLAFCTDHGAPFTLAVTSTRPGEGKSTTAYAIALSLARTGKNVLLLDADMRAPTAHHIADIGNHRGLSNFLAGDNNLEEMLHRPAGSEVAIMPAGPQPPNAAELLSGDRMKTLLDRLQPSFDHIVIDSPPVMGLADAPLLASQSEGTVFVVESNNTKLGQAKLAISRLSAAQAHLVGAVLTKFDTKRAAYGYGYDYGYGYGRSAEASA
ncbi:polysaccharide biosynthesis tyrosine autokinase [Sphingosinicella sp. LHD-64]|uniref:GumC family protein n=1 Tax=Sphingosinicella sp. LHD-64 TaxID=3072139 RepID=UPI002810320C|nr:polysaccharide biosynthesis tyrosine autokinase [Sphingosinicella sp. LHD-64]MDQ8757235.1 polysaccharide biosynthesis tyrosine autokinase [Sphingosinicella sp. LHD-64]